MCPLQRPNGDGGAVDKASSEGCGVVCQRIDPHQNTLPGDSIQTTLYCPLIDSVKDFRGPN